MAAVYLTSLTNTTTDNGTFAGVLVVTDPSTHAVKVRAALTGVSTGSSGVTMNGLIVGHVQDFGTQLTMQRTRVEALDGPDRGLTADECLPRGFCAGAKTDSTRSKP